MRVAALYRYPVKSLGGESPDSLQPMDRGFADDRRWMLVDAGGRFISQREYPHLTRLAARLSGPGGLSILEQSSGATVAEISDARPVSGDRVTVTVWDDTFQAMLVPTLPDFGNAIGLPGARLVFMDAASHRPVDQRYAAPEETVSFADGFPYLFANANSLSDLAGRMGDAELDMLRFRPNLVIEGAPAYAEDDWAELSVGHHRFRLPKPCARCIMITNEPRTGERDPAVLTTLAGYRKRGNKVLFGENALWTAGEGAVRVGDPVAVLSRKAK